MKKLTMNDHIKSGSFANKTVEEVTKIKGAIFSMIKEGYEFDDEVLKAARIRKIIRDEKIDFVAARILKKYRRAFEELAK